ncbi:MAG TPA: hypothetical protein VGE29_13500 [Prosthecobacter sp.]
MADPWSFQFNNEKLESSFCSLQPVSDSVQAAESPMPGCCSRTSLTLSCRGFERGYALALPLKTRLPNETPDSPPQNSRMQVMTAQLPPPMLQVLSVHDGKEVAEIAVSAQGANQCPPGQPNRVKVDGVGGGLQDVPFNQWGWKAPAILDSRLMEPLGEDMISLLHPFKAPALPAQVWSLSVPGCPAAKLKASVAAFPDVRWHGRLVLRTEAKPNSTAGFVALLDGDLACLYNGQEFKVTGRDQLRALCRWTDAVEVLAKCAVALMALRPGTRLQGLDNPRLEKHGELRLSPWPQLSLQVDSQLFEQEGNGLLGHALKVLVSGDPLMGAQGEISLLPAWLEDPGKRRLLAPLLVGLDAVRVEEVAQELGLWLVAEGQVSLRAGIESRRPSTSTQSLGRAAGRLALNLEIRSLREYDTLVAHYGGAEDITAPAGLSAVCEPAPESPLPDPLGKPCRALLSFTGCSVAGLEKWRPGCRFRRWQPPGAKPPSAVPMLPARSWPSGGEPGQAAEIPWC